MNAVSLFSGIGGLDLGFERAGFQTVAQAEIDPKCLSLLAHRWPDVHRFTDVKDVTRDSLASFGPITLIHGGFPCQDLSIAGRRAGLDGAKSGLWREFHRILGDVRPEWVVVENVPGLLSSKEGEDFATLTGSLLDLGYGVAWRVLDAQFFGVPQRRRRVLIVGHLGNAERAGRVLALGEGEGGATGQSQTPWPRLTGRAGYGVGGTTGHSIAKPLAAKAQGYRNDLDNDTYVVAPTLTARYGKGARVDADDALIVQNYDAPIVAPVDLANITNALNATRVEYGAPANTLHQGGQSAVVVAFAQNQQGHIYTSPYVGAISTNSNASGRGTAKVLQNHGVRRLMPVECERLQGFPDGWTVDFAKTVRYRMLGNAVAVPVAAWVADRLAEEIVRG